MIPARRFLFIELGCARISRRMLSRQTYDVAVIGGGMVGCALAACAGSSKYFKDKSILLVESTSPKLWLEKAPGEFDIRVSAVNPGSVQMMQKIGVWDIVEQLRRPQNVIQLRVWDSGSSSSIHYEHPNLEENVAYIVENSALLTAFWRRLGLLKNVETISECGPVKRFKCPGSNDGDNFSSIELEDGTTIKAKLLIGADGFNSAVRKAMNVHELKWNYEQKGIVGTLQIAESENENNVAWQRFTPTGPIALLPLDKRTSSLVWTTTSSEADRLTHLKPEQFLDELNHGIFSATSELSSVNRLLDYLPKFDPDYHQLPPRIVGLRSQLASFPLGFQHSTNYVTRGVALIGDAAHRVHPLAGQGVNLGFGDAVCLVECLEKAIGRGDEISTLSVLRDYETQRQWHNLSVMLTVDGLNRLYATSSMPVVFIRSLGLNVVNQSSILKQFLMKRASV